MARSVDESENSGSDEEYEVEYVYAAKWSGSGWDYEVHWYGYDTDCDTWEPEVHLTEYGSADLVNRFWKQFPKKRYSHPTVGTVYRAPRDWLADERKNFLARRPKNKTVKGLVKPPRKKAEKLVLVGDSESEPENGKAKGKGNAKGKANGKGKEHVKDRSSDFDPEDILRSSSEEKYADEDILRSSSSEETPLVHRARHSLPQAQAGSSTGPGTKARMTIEKRRHSIQSHKPTQPTTSRPTPAAASTSKSPYAPPVVRTTKIAKDPIPPSRRGRPINRPNMQAGSISSDFVGIGAKGKQAERAGEVLTLGRRASVPNSSVPVPLPAPGRTTSAYAGMTMRKGPSAQPAGGAGGASGAFGGGARVDSPIELSPIEVTANIPSPSLNQEIDDMVNSISAGIEEASPPNSLFDGSEGEDEAPPAPQANAMDYSLNLDGMDLDFPQFMDDPVPPPPVPAPAPKQGTRPARPTISTTAAVTRGSIDGPISARGPQSDQSFGLSPLLNTRPLDTPTRPAIPPLQPGQWHWTGDLYLATDEPVPGDEDKTHEVRSRACEVVIRDPVLPDDNETKRFTSTIGGYVKDKITISGAMDVNLSYSIITSGALEPTQAAWMVCTDNEESPEWELWDGLLHKMELFFWVSDVRLYNANNVELASRLILIPTTLMQKYRRTPHPGLAKIVEQFDSPMFTSTPGFVVLMCKNVTGSDEPEDWMPMQLDHLPKYWQEIPPDLKPSFKGIHCLVFPPEEHDYDYEVRLMRHQLRQCGAELLEGSEKHDSHGKAGAIFVHRRYVDNLSKLLGFSDRKRKYRKRFYVYGSGGNWRVDEWDLREVWIWGGMVTFTPAAMLEDPWAVKKVVEVLEEKPFWETYIEPKTLGVLALRSKENSELAEAIDLLLTELVTSNSISFYNLALTAPPKWGKREELEWTRVAYERSLIDDVDELRASCEEEVMDAYREAKEAEAEKEKEKEKEKGKEKEVVQKGKQKEKARDAAANAGWGSTGNDAGWGSGGGWGDGGGKSGGGGNEWGTAGGGWGTGGDDGEWGSAGGGDNAGWGATNNTSNANTNNTTSAPQVDMSGLGSAAHIQTMCDEVIEGLKWFQIQPCFMREIRRFIVIDSTERRKKVKPERLEVEVMTADEFVKSINEGRWW